MYVCVRVFAGSGGGGSGGGWECVGGGMCVREFPQASII